jgi:hypothetical protein
MAEYGIELQRELTRRGVSADKYEPVFPEADRLAYANLQAHVRACGGRKVRVPRELIVGASEHAVGDTYDGPVTVPSPKLRRGLAIVGGRGVGKTSLLARVAWGDALDASVAVVTLETRPAPIGARFSPTHPCAIPDGVRSGERMAIVSDDPSTRELAVASAAYAAAALKRPVSLIVDDAGDLLRALILVYDVDGLHVSAAWNPQARDADVTLFGLLESKMLFRLDDLDTAERLGRVWDATVVDGVQLPRVTLSDATQRSLDDLS